MMFKSSRSFFGVVLLVYFLTIQFSCVQNSPEDHNVKFESVHIGKQEWATSNLNVTNFQNGDPIFEANSFEEWEEACIKGLPAWCYYDNNPENGRKYGKLYNFWAVSDPRELAPKGWKIPTDKEWEILAESLGGMDSAGGKMKKGNYWIEGERNNNESGFSGLPGGFRSHEMPGFMWGPFYGNGKNVYWWSTSTYLVDNVWAYSLTYDSDKLGKESFVKTSGLYVRLLKE